MVHRRAADALERDRITTLLRRARARVGSLVAVALLLGRPALGEAPWERPARNSTREEILALWEQRPQGPCATGNPWTDFEYGPHTPATIALLQRFAEEPATRLMALRGLAYTWDADLFPFLKRTVELTDLVPEEIRTLVDLLMMSRHPEAQALAEAQWGRGTEWTHALLVHAASGRWKKPGRERLEAFLRDGSQPSYARIHAFEALSRGGEMPLEELARLGLADGDARLRGNAASAAKKALLFEDLLAVVQDPDKGVRNAALDALADVLRSEGSPLSVGTHRLSPVLARAYARVTMAADSPDSPLRGSVSLMFLLGHHAERQGDFERAERFYRQAVALPLTYDSLLRLHRGLSLLHLSSLLLHNGRAGEVAPLIQQLSELDSDFPLRSNLPYTQSIDERPAAVARRLREVLEFPLALSLKPAGPGLVRITLRNVSHEARRVNLYALGPKKSLPGTLVVRLDGYAVHGSIRGGGPPMPRTLQPGESLSFMETYRIPSDVHGRNRLEALLDVELQGPDGGVLKRQLVALRPVVLP